MSLRAPSRPPMWCRSLVWVAAWLVPTRARAEWRAKWRSVLANAWILSQRGEIEPRVLRHCCADCLADVFHGWISRPQVRQFLRSPSLVLARAVPGIATLA